MESKGNVMTETAAPLDARKMFCDYVRACGKTSRLALTMSAPPNPTTGIASELFADENFDLLIEAVHEEHIPNDVAAMLGLSSSTAYSTAAAIASERWARSECVFGGQRMTNEAAKQVFASTPSPKNIRA
jgi:hypothetical protein